MSSVRHSGHRGYRGSSCFKPEPEASGTDALHVERRRSAARKKRDDVGCARRRAIDANVIRRSRASRPFCTARSRDVTRNPLRTRAIVAPSAAAVVESRRAHVSTEGVTPMERKKASDFPPEVLKLFDGYVHGMISRRDFLDG